MNNNNLNATPKLDLLYDDFYIQVIEDHINENLIFIYNNKYDDEAIKQPDIRILSLSPFDPTTDDLIRTIKDLLKDKNAPTESIIEDFKESILYAYTEDYFNNEN